jgi:hypothetical protein
MREISRRGVLGSVVALAATAACADDVERETLPTCDIWSSTSGDCTARAAFEYADPGINAGHVYGPRRFCSEHVGCATSALVSV